METKQVSLQLKDISAEGTFVGLAAVYGNRDMGGDVILPGAFTKTIAENGGKFPLYYGHKISIGVSMVEDSADGLLTRGIINLDKQIGKDVHSDLRFWEQNGMKFGMSIGYMSVPDKTEFKNDTRYLKELMLFENTLTEVPMNGRARVRNVKGLEGIEELAFYLTEMKAGRKLSAETMGRMREIMTDHSRLISDHQTVMGKLKALMDSAEGMKSSEPPNTGNEPAKDHSGLISQLDQLKGVFQHGTRSQTH